MRSFRSLALSAVAAFSLGSLALDGYQIQPAAFHIAIIDGDGALNNVEGRLAREPIVQVEDENHKRVPGAYVAFDTPSTGPGAAFENGSTHLVVPTDSNGQAVAHGLVNNGVAGAFAIQVQVTYQGRTVATTAIHQVNVCSRVANISPTLDRNLPPPSRPNRQPANDASPSGVAGVAVGNNFSLDDTPVFGNANLMNGTRLQSLADPIRIFLGDNCQFLMAPQSSVTVASGQLSLVSGMLRAEPFGNCSVAVKSVKAVGTASDAQGIVRINNGKLEVASVDGGIKVVNAQNQEQGTVAACSASAFAIPGGAGSGGGLSKPALFGILAGAAAGVGAAVGAAGGHGSSNPTSP